MARTTLHFDAILFDMDGTLVDSTVGVVGAWNMFREAYPSIDVENILSSAHGVRTVDNLKKFCGIEDPEILEAEAERFEKAILSSASAEGKQGIVQLPGVKAVMDEIASARFLPTTCWAICTSATREYASSAMNIAGVSIPDVFVTSEDVSRGKPFPDPYLLGAQKAGVKPENCVVFEDAPNGIISGREAGCKTIALLTSHTLEQVKAAKPDYIVKNLSSVTITLKEKGVAITIDALEA